MKKIITILISLLIVQAVSAGTVHAQSNKTAGSTQSVNNAPITLNAEDAENLYSVLFELDLITEYPAAEDGEVTDLICTLDRLILGETADLEKATTCVGISLNEKKKILGAAAVTLFNILSNYSANEVEGPAYTMYTAKKLSVSYDRLAGQINAKLIK